MAVSNIQRSTGAQTLSPILGGHNSKTRPSAPHYHKSITMAPTNSLRVKTGPMMTDQRSSHLPAVPLSAQQQHERQQQQQAAIDRAKIRARKPTDKTLPDGVEDSILSDGAQRYRELRDFERRLDATITRKRLDVVDSVGRSVKVRLRSWFEEERDRQG